MDGQMGDGEQVAVKAHEACFGIERVGRTQHHTAGKRQGTVEPGVKNRAAIDLGVEFDDISLAEHLTVGLEAEAGGIAVSRNDVETAAGGIGTDHEGENGGIVLCYVIFAAGHEVPLVAHRKAHETSIFKMCPDRFYGKEIDGRRIEKRSEVFVIVHIQRG